jgi:hypothetical protein
MGESFTKLVESKAAMNKAFEEAKGVAKAAMSEACAEVFAENPDLLAFRWAQYTPYFNDGDPCTFGTHDVYFKFSDTPDEAGDYGDGFVDIWRDEKREPLRKRVNSIMSTVGDDLLQELFEDHSQVTVHRDGRIEREEYSHD